MPILGVALLAACTLAGLAATDPKLLPCGAMISTFYTGLGCLPGPSPFHLVVKALV